MSSAEALAEAIRSELRRSGLRLPVVTDTGQAGPATAVAARRTGGAAWLVDYQAATGVSPPGATPAWTEQCTGTAEQAVADGILTISSDSGEDSLFNYLALPALDNAAGTLAEARLRIASAEAAANRGACLAVFDGTYLCVLWLRPAGLNIDGNASVACALNEAVHRVSLHVRGAEVRAYVDGELLQTGSPTAPTALRAVAFGSWVRAAGCL